MSIKCYKCGSINNELAKYCAKCGQPIVNNSDFILDTSDINFIPSSNFKFEGAKSKKYLYQSIVIILSIIILFISFCVEDKSDLETIVPFTILITLVILWILHIRYLIKKSLFNIQKKCSLVEKRENRYLRIVQNNKVGIMDSTALKILLSTNYDSVILMENYSYLYIIKKDNKYGLYNCAIKRMVIPIIQERIAYYKSDIFSATIKSNISYYDINGNKLN